MPVDVRIAEYDSQWPDQFRRVADEIRRELGNVALRIDHIGSTSIRGLRAKPCIDIQICVQSLEPVEAYRSGMERLGYDFRSKNPEKTKRYFKRPGPPPVHVHVRALASFGAQFPLLFRDYMREHPEDAKAYEDLKCRLAGQYQRDRLAYTSAKDDFIWDIMKKADKWAQTNGWQPGPSDA